MGVSVGRMGKDRVDLQSTPLPGTELHLLDLVEQVSIAFRFAPALLFRAKMLIFTSMQLIESVASLRMFSLICAS